MRCNKCNAEMYNAKLTGNTLYPLILTNKKKGMLEPEKRCYVLCYVCPECGYIEIYAEKPKELKIDWQIPIWQRYKMKKHKITAALYYVAAILSYISAIVNFEGENSRYLGGLWICIGSTLLYLGISHSKKSKENKDKEDK